MKNFFFIVLSLLLFSCENKVNEENLDEILKSERSEILLIESHGSIFGESSRWESSDKFEMININDKVKIRYFTSAFHNDEIYKFQLNDAEVDSFILILKEAVKTHEPKKLYAGCCMCSNIDFNISNSKIKMEVKLSEKVEYLFYDLREKYDSILRQKQDEYYSSSQPSNLNFTKKDSIQSHYFKNNFVNLFDQTDVVSIIEDSIDFSFDFDLHGYDCGAPDCYSTYVDFSVPFSDSVTFPKTINMKVLTAGNCLEGEIPKYYTFYLADVSDDFLIFNSKGAKKSLVLNTNNKKFDNKVYYFSAIIEPVTLKNVESLLSFDENTKEFNMPFRSNTLVKKL